MAGVPTVFLDRDGVINRKLPEGEYVTRWERFEFLPRVAEALRLLRGAGLRLVVVTNQRGVALGRFTEADLEALHRRMLQELERAGGGLHAVYYCPHDRGQCACRKPDTGLFLRARADFPEIDFGRSPVVGDSLCDLAAAARLGCPAYLVGEGPRREEVLAEARRRGVEVRGVAGSLYELAATVLLPVLEKTSFASRASRC